MEVRYLRDVERAHGFPTVVVRHRQSPPVRLHDVAYDAQRVLVELDGELGHAGAGGSSTAAATAGARPGAG